jgi:hypothetical protein
MSYKRIEYIKVGDLLHDNLYGTDGRLLVSIVNHLRSNY